MKAVTDFTSAVTFSPEERPGVSNLINIHNLFTGLTPEEICEQSMCLETAQYKLVLAEIVIEKLKPLQKRIDNILKEPQHIQYVLQKGAEKATEIAISTMTQVKKLLGML
ncbi:tryptophan--tRNA ligase, mitochondrial-like [Tachypleus tridentatus]|uniref:tryptophan--tRNA ligase, mitochondrial-like n=1 Tax=Tachypleus tridentatus TaxID=6853 RepID=UPI003FD10857